MKNIKLIAVLMIGSVACNCVSRDKKPLVTDESNVNSQTETTLSDTLGTTEVVNSDTLGTTEVKAMELFFVNMNIETPIAIRCEDFNGNFRRSLKIITIRDSLAISKILRALNMQSDSSSQRYFDTRRKLVIHWRNKPIENICIDQFGCMRNGRIYKYEGDFRNVIEGLLPVKAR